MLQQLPTAEPTHPAPPNQPSPLGHRAVLKPCPREMWTGAALSACGLCAQAAASSGRRPQHS